MSAPTTPGATPARFFSVVNSFHNVAVMKAAIELGVFTALAQGHNTPDKVAAACKVNPRGARILLDHLTVMEFLHKTSDHYGLADDAALFLDQNSPAYVGASVEFLTEPTMRGNFDALTQRVRVGGAPLDDKSVLKPNNDVWVK